MSRAFERKRTTSAPTVQSDRTRSVAFCGLCIAIMVVSAWITVPFGPVPFTLQIFALVFAILVLQPKEAVASVAIYLFMGAVGLPVFSSMRGGIGVLMGPTGGFLWGCMLGAILVAAILTLVDGKRKQHSTIVDAMAAVVFVLVSYACGWLQLAAVTHMGLLAAFGTGIAPFIIVDAIKIAIAVAMARTVRGALHL